MISQLRVRGGERRVVERQHTSLRRAFEGGAQRVDRPSRAPLVEGLAELWEATRLADHQSA